MATALRGHVFPDMPTQGGGHGTHGAHPIGVDHVVEWVELRDPPSRDRAATGVRPLDPVVGVWPVAPHMRAFLRAIFVPLALTALALPTPARAAEPAGGLAAAAAIEAVFADVIRRVEPSIVSVARIRSSPAVTPFNPFDLENEGRSELDRPETPDFVPNEFGTGIVVAPVAGSGSRFILTNYHVVRGGTPLGAAPKPSDSQLYVRFPDRRGYYARIVAADPRSDLALLSIDLATLNLQPAELKPLPLTADESTFQKGRLVLAMGNPYAIARDGSASASWGMIGNVARRPARPRLREAAPARSDTIHQFGTLLQVDARLDLGASGGALVNLRGELVGITTSLAALEGYEKSVGFAIPLDDFARRVIDALGRGYEVEYGFLGLTSRSILPEQMKRYGGTFKQLTAVRVDQIITNSPADKARIQPDDVILSIDGRPLLDQYDLMRYVGRCAPESTIRLVVWRPRERAELTLSAKLGKWPVVDEDAIVATSRRYPAWRGLSVDYPSGRSKHFGWPFQYKDAVLVTHVAPKSPAQAAGLAEGDFVARVNGTSVETPAQFQKAVAGLDGEATLDLSDRRRIAVGK
jgi:serine protease Do